MKLTSDLVLLISASCAEPAASLMAKRLLSCGAAMGTILALAELIQLLVLLPLPGNANRTLCRRRDLRRNLSISDPQSTAEP